MREQVTKSEPVNQSVLEAQEQCEVAMAIEGLVPGTRKAYTRALQRFCGVLKGRSPGEATVKEARGYLAELKRSGASRNVLSHASAALRFYFEKVRNLEWEPVSPLRRRMIEDMQLRGFSPKTQSSYVRSVLGLARHYRRSPDRIVEEEIRRYFVHLTCERKLARPTITIALCGIKFFYVKTLKRDWSLTGVPVPKREKKLPVVLSHKEACKILSCVRVPRHRACLDQLRAMRAIEACHTAAAGEALWRCPRCAKRHFTFLGCGNRHCPACGATRAEQWRRKHSALLLPGVVYHLIGFTVPAGLRRAIRSHPRELLELLMRLSSSALLDVCANPKWLGATPGLTAVLHTWTRQYEYHPHVHFIATGGGIDDQGRWVEAHPKFLVPVHALSAILRARFRDALREQHPEIFARIKPTVWKQKKWVVHSKPVGAGHTTLAYLARYVYRVALSQRAILRHQPDCITLRYRKSDSNKPRALRLNPQEFIRRFLQHVLPSGFRKIRYFGLHHSSKRPLLRLLQAAMAIQQGQPLPIPMPAEESFVPTCPHCDEPMRFEGRISAHRRASLFPSATQTRGPP